MDVKKEPKKQPEPVRRTNKTKEDFLRWLREKEALKKQTEEEPKT